MKARYDIVVVGGGPAGSTAAKYAAMNGVSVALFERDREIGVPVRCGEAVSEEGLKKFIKPDPAWIASTIQEIRFVSPGGLIVDAHTPSRGYILHRRLFDHSLAIEAANQGVEVFTKAYVYSLNMNRGVNREVHFRHIGNDYKVEAGIVIAADGVESRVARFAGLRSQIQLKDIESCVQMTVGNVDLNPERMDFYFSEKWAPGGYVWVFPKGNRTANIGLGVNGKYAGKHSALKLLRLFLDEKFPETVSLTTVAGGVPVAKTLKKIVTDGLMIVGDAARQINPMTGGGIIAGMAAGKMAGTIAAKAIQLGDTSTRVLMEYQKSWNKSIGKDYERFYRLKEWISKLSDDDLDKIAKSLQGIEPKDITMSKIFSLAVVKNPALLIDVARVFAGI